MEQVIRQMGRDAQILAHLAKHGFASPKNIEDTFFSGRANRNHYRSIARLRKKGFVENLTGDHNHLLGYKPTKRGLRVAELLTKTPSLSPHRFKFRTTYDHDELLIQIRSIFESSTLVSHFQPEVVLREQLATRYGHKEVEGLGYKVPDGLFVLQTQKRNFRVALELELTRKSSCRYRKIIKQLARSRDWDIILYIVKNKHIKCVIQNLLQELREKDSDLHSENFEHGFYFAELSETLSQKLDVQIAGEGTTFSLNALAQMSFEKIKSGDGDAVTFCTEITDVGKTVRG